MLRDKVQQNPAAALVLVMLTAVCLIGIQTATGNTLAAVCSACVISLIIAILCGATAKEMKDQVLLVLKRSASTVVILALIAYACGVWLTGGTIAVMLYGIAKISLPRLSLMTAFLASGLMAYITGSSFSTISSMGLVTMLVAVGFGMNQSAAVGAVVSGAVLGNKISPVSDTVNLTCSMCEIDHHAHRKAMRLRTLLATAVTAGVFLILGLISPISSDGSVGETMCRQLRDSFQLSPLCLLPLCVLIALTYTKLSTIQNLILTIAVSVVCGAVSQKIPLHEMLLAGLTGFRAPTGAEGIIRSLSGGGLLASGKTLTAIVLTNVLGGLLVSSSITTLLFDRVKQRERDERSLALAVWAMSLGILFMTGNQVLAIILVAPAFSDLFSKQENGLPTLAGIFADTTVVCGPLLPWSVMRLFTAQCYHLDSCAYIPFAVFCIVMPLTALLRIVQFRPISLAKRKAL